MLAELREVLIFCALYSGVILLSLGWTLSQRKLMQETRKESPRSYKVS